MSSKKANMLLMDEISSLSNKITDMEEQVRIYTYIHLGVALTYISHHYQCIIYIHMSLFRNL